MSSDEQLQHLIARFEWKHLDFDPNFMQFGLAVYTYAQEELEPSNAKEINLSALEFLFFSLSSQILADEFGFDTTNEKPKILRNTEEYAQKALSHYEHFLNALLENHYSYKEFKECMLFLSGAYLLGKGENPERYIISKINDADQLITRTSNDYFQLLQKTALEEKIIPNKFIEYSKQQIKDSIKEWDDFRDAFMASYAIAALENLGKNFNEISQRFESYSRLYAKTICN